MNVYVVTDIDPDSTDSGRVSMSYWSTLRKAQGALARYRRHRLVTKLAEVTVIGVDVDAFAKRRAT